MIKLSFCEGRIVFINLVNLINIMEATTSLLFVTPPLLQAELNQFDSWYEWYTLFSAATIGFYADYNEFIRQEDCFSRLFSQVEPFMKA